MKKAEKEERQDQIELHCQHNGLPPSTHADLQGASLKTSALMISGLGCEVVNPLF
jgi:hypothetical protein